jgi:hypothetical protein
MRNLSDDRPDPARPTLVVTYGNTPRKYRCLERDIVVIGRAPGCEIALASTEVAPIHCVLARGPNGWRVRDCSGRGATRVNGAAVADSPLRNGDTLQVGSFCFEAHLPPAAAAAIMPPGESAIPVATPAEPAPTADEKRRLEQRAQELTRFAEQLRRREEEINAHLAQRHEEVAKAETTVREQRAELVRRMSDLARAGQTNRGNTGKADSANRNTGKAESANRQDAEALRLQLSMLRQELAGRDSIIAGLRVRIEQVERSAPSRESIEHEHEELGRLRDDLNQRMAQLDEQRKDLEEATREAELQAARERGQLLRDRTELERLLEEFRFEQERARHSVSAYGSTEGASLEPIVRGSGSHPATSKWSDFGPEEGEQN